MYTTFDTIVMLGLVNAEIRNMYETCIAWIDSDADETTNSSVFRTKSEKEINDFAFYCDGVIRTLEMMKINVDEQRNLIGNLIERAEQHMNKYL